MRPVPKPHPLYTRKPQRYDAAKLSDGVRHEAADHRISPRDAAQLIGDSEVLRWARAH